MISTGKAITLDGLSDVMFKEDFYKRAAKIFQDLWSINLDEIPGFVCTLTSRLIPLNKNFPNIPNRYEMRPILVCSPLQKLLEARFLPKLKAYLVNRLTPCQTGFIPNMGIQVNLVRTIFKITEAKEIGRNRYGLFIDFANAYNTVPHTLLFKKLRDKKCLEEDEINYLEALYSRYRIRIGKRIIKFNKGVAQGSIISPALFNIFIEDLVEELAQELQMSIQDILLYADDILLLCETIPQVKRCIQIIENWSSKNGMKLNKKKSGIMVFAPREDKDIPCMILTTKKIQKGKRIIFEKEWIPACKEIMGIPLVNEYKYLGTRLDCKLTMKKQLDFIKEKANFRFTRLYPYLSNATAGGRKDMWRTMICPLFNALLALLYFEPSKLNKEKVLKLWRETFKRFMIIPKNTKTELVDEMIGIDFEDLIYVNTQNSAIKWQARCERIRPKLIERKERVDYLRGVPNEWCSILKQQSSLCPLCKNSIRNARHMENVHGIEILPYDEIWEGIKELYEYETKKQKKKDPIKKVKREVFLKRWKPFLKEAQERTADSFKKIYLSSH